MLRDLGRRSRGQDHREALALLRQVTGGDRMAQDLRRLLDIKDGAQYGTVYVSQQRATAAVKQARRLVERQERSSGERGVLV